MCPLELPYLLPSLPLITKTQMTQGRGQKAEVGGQKAEDRRQRTEDRGQKSEVRSQRTEDRGQKAEDRRQRSEVRSQRSEDSLVNCASVGSSASQIHGTTS